jgi:HK97 gp10 family phage protein
MPAVRTNVSIRGLSELEAKLKELPKAVRRSSTMGLYRSGGMVRDEAKRLLDEGPKTGHKYSWLPFRSSAPGEAPASQTGKLRNSIVSVFDRASFTVNITAKDPKAAWLEFGTRMMAARPFMAKALRNSVSVIKEVMTYDILGAIRAVTRK